MRTTSGVQAALFVTLAVFTLMGCGHNGPAAKRGSDKRYNLNQSDTQTLTGSDLRNRSSSCSSTPNVTPDYDWGLGNAMYFTACADASDPAKLTIRGLPQKGRRICVFPAEQTDETHIFPKPDTSSGFPLYQCAEASLSGASFTFAGMQINFVFVVPEHLAHLMQQCLATGEYSDCPVYRPETFSRGRYR